MPSRKARSEAAGRTVVEDAGHRWRMTVIGLALVIVTAVITGLLVAGWGPRTGLEALFASAASSPPGTFSPRPVAQSPSPADVEACNQYAKAQAGDKAIEVVKEGAAGAGRGAGKGAMNGGMVSAAAGTLNGIDERKKNDARYVEAYRACMKGRGFSS